MVMDTHLVIESNDNQMCYICFHLSDRSIMSHDDFQSRWLTGDIDEMFSETIFNIVSQGHHLITINTGWPPDDISRAPLLYGGLQLFTDVHQLFYGGIQLIRGGLPIITVISMPPLITWNGPKYNWNFQLLIIVKQFIIRGLESLNVVEMF